MSSFIEKIAPNLYAYRERFLLSLSQSALLFIIPGVIAFIIGLALGVILTVTRKDGIRPNK